MSKPRGGYCLKEEDRPKWPMSFSATILYKMLGADYFKELCLMYDEQIKKNKQEKKEKNTPTNDDLIKEIDRIF